MLAAKTLISVCTVFTMAVLLQEVEAVCQNYVIGSHVIMKHFGPSLATSTAPKGVKALIKLGVIAPPTLRSVSG